MRIAIINRTGGGMSGGYRKYLLNVIPRMATHRDIDAILCASPKSLNVQDWFAALPNVRFVDCKPFRFLHHSPGPDLKRQLERFLPDVIFIPMERYLRFKKVPVVSIVRNMWPLAWNSKNYPLVERVKFLCRAIESRIAVEKSDRIVAVSNFVQDFLIKKWKVSANCIRLVYHGCNLLDEWNKECEKPDSVLDRWAGDFLFTAGSIEPFRGLEDAFRALKYLESQNIEIGRLVIAGDIGPRMFTYQNKLKDWLKRYNLSSKVCWPGRLNGREMSWCYRHCKAFIMTSRVESFGMVAVEAMAYGCVCISANNPCLPEIFADAAVYYPPKDYKALAEAIESVLAWNDNKRNKASDKAKKRAVKFSWDVCVERTVEELAKAVRE